MKISGKFDVILKPIESEETWRIRKGFLKKCEDMVEKYIVPALEND